MSIKINKQLQRPDKGPLSPGSIIDFTPILPVGTQKIRYNLIHWFDELTKEEATEKGWFPIESITNFKYILIKECTDEEFAKLKEANADILIEQWLKELIDLQIGDGNTEMI